MVILFMDNLNSIIDLKRLNLIKKQITPRESKKLEKKLSLLFKGFSKDSLNFISIIDRFNDPSFDQNKLEKYNTGTREIVIINRDYKIKDAISNILKEDFIGFDTEQRPTFKRGEKQKNFALIQIATKDFCYLFQTKYLHDIKPIIKIITNEKIIKVGFDLKNDNKEFKNQLNIEPKNIFDLSPFMKRNLLHKNQIGVKNSVALILLKQMQKSKKIAMSNWENRILNENQIKYASEDATAPYDIFSYLYNNFPTIIS
ncbi:3'-5' exonuclease domain-containing protein 2 [Thiospirochaeta perfilievii]|uniref:3'-5' exonuclease n=1 Tax=Thiospirochaeta perfilievii TaxID=252967 RepID=A0A5C1QAR8_9SPIO|nr:3'-5' exonuclease [Thiospirochaeta perfilievii]QEN03896.1 3'-5' exonuclease domain-containing protein 2 [Thiospirochaeta perfilievii]